MVAAELRRRFLFTFYTRGVISDFHIRHSQAVGNLGRELSTSTRCDQSQAKYFPVMKSAMLPPKTFEGKTAFITGGGTGLGKVMAEMLSSLGANVAIAARRLPILEETAKEISTKTGNQVLPVQLDVKSPESIQLALDKVEEKYGIATIIINNAAGNFISPFERLSPNGWKSVIDIVLNGTAFVTLDAGKRLIKAKTGGSILSITTTYTQAGSAFVCPSSAAKSGVETLMKSLSSEWGRYGIRLNCIAPGPFPTEGAWKRLDPSGEMAATMMHRIPAGRAGDPTELANLASYLLSDYASWITGETVVLDGGEFNDMAGEMNLFKKVTNDQWDEIEKQIKLYNKKSKGK